MDATNRLLAVSAALVWIFLVFVVILLAWGAPDQSIERIGDLAGYLDDHNTNGAKLIITFGGLIFVLLGVILILVEIAPPETGSVRVSKVSSGSAVIGTDEVTRQLEQALQAVPKLRAAEAKVQSRGRKAEVKLNLYVEPDADLARTADEACRRAREVVEEHMGVELDSPPQAQVHYQKPQEERKRPTMTEPERPPAPIWQSSSAGSGPAQPAPPPSGAPSESPQVTSGPFNEASSTSREDQPPGA